MSKYQVTVSIKDNIGILKIKISKNSILQSYIGYIDVRRTPIYRSPRGYGHYLYYSAYSVSTSCKAFSDNIVAIHENVFLT